MLRFFFTGFSVEETGRWDLAPGPVHWPFALMVISVATMTLGNVAALTQTNMKRLLAYSSIAHAGYILMGIVALSWNGARGLMVYLLAYLFMNLGAFLVVTLIHHQEGTFDVRDYQGLYKRAPFLTLAMSIFLLSLMGIPPLVGFMGKLYVFAAVVDRALGTGPDHVWYLWYGVIAALNAAVAAFYYARVLKTMIIEEGSDKPALTLPALDSVWIAILLAGNVVPLFFWSSLEGWARASLSLYAGR
jgi:NADH-quinone oxidoreductase subunit N